MLNSITNLFNDFSGVNLMKFTAELAVFGIFGNFAIDLAGDMFIEPLLFDPLHGNANVTMQAWKELVKEKMGWVTDWLGITGDSGLMQMDFIQNWLEPYMERVDPTKNIDIPEGMLDSYNSSQSAGDTFSELDF